MNRKKSHSRRKSPYGWIAAVCILGGAAVLGGLYLEKSTIIQEVGFSGNYYTEPEELLASFESPVGMIADSIAFQQILEEIKTPPYVKDVSITMNRRGILDFRITEHQPLAMITNNVKRYYLAEGGYLLPILPDKIVDVPILYAWEPVNEGRLSGEAWNIMEEFLIAANKNRFAWLTLSEISWNQQEGVTALSTENGIKLIFGKEGFAGKLDKWELFYSQVAARKGTDQFHTVDLRFEDQIVTRNS